MHAKAGLKTWQIGILASPIAVLVLPACLPALSGLFSGQSEFLRMDQFTHIYKGEHIAQTSEGNQTECVHAEQAVKGIPKQVY